ncbi:MAG: benzoate-CoA ligase family protein [Pyrinomonadaceae bacterium]
MNLVEYIFQAADKLNRWSETAILCGDEQTTYKQLFRRVKKFGRLLETLGVGRGERVAIAACDCPEFIISFLGAAAVGAVAVPVSTMMTANELSYVLKHCGAKVLILTSDQIEKVQSIRSDLDTLENILLVNGEAEGILSFDEMLARVEEAEILDVSDDTLAFILYTSGSTGQPKGATHIHRNLPFTVETFCKQVLRVEPSDRLFSSSRLFFAYGLGNSLSFPLASGATTILCKERPTPQVIAEVFQQNRPTIFFAVPAAYRALIEFISKGNALETDSIRFCVSAGEKLPEGIFYEWKTWTGLDILDGIGSTEMLQMFISNSKDRIVPGSSGQVVPGYEAKLLDQQGQEIEGAGTGHLMIKGASASVGYWNDALKTDATMQGEWMRTGDLYRRDADGNFWHEGRSDDLFKVKGLWVSPVEVEDALLSCADVLEAAVVPGLNEDGMNAVSAYVVMRADAGDGMEERLKTELKTKLPPYKRPSVIHFMEQLPRTATGKLQRFKLRERRADTSD